MINNRYFPNSFFADHLILINFSAIFAYRVHKIKFILLYMGRISRSYPKGKLKLRAPKKAQPDKKYQIYIEYNWQADNARKSTGISVFAKEWNDKGYGGIGEILLFFRLFIPVYPIMTIVDRGRKRYTFASE